MTLLGRAGTGPGARFAPAFGAALMFALALFVRPNLAPAAGVLAGRRRRLPRSGSGKGWRVAGLCIGFLPVLGMALHNWVYGGVFVLFTSTADASAGAADAAVGLSGGVRRTGAARLRGRARDAGAAQIGALARRSVGTAW